ncbi:hypothetical protein BP5796_03957 [Coleophoma crateriformis]|uniref:Uncharacterized protein n=1 Tax=Coleophoma crateriformis TaxID=565419 RepID=A0A3D8SH81_9HELO|nr:hypothetical protein BP5796_03957 [Coleophoma crateriformis]
MEQALLPWPPHLLRSLAVSHRAQTKQDGAERETPRKEPPPKSRVRSKAIPAATVPTLTLPFSIEILNPA